MVPAMIRTIALTGRVVLLAAAAVLVAGLAFAAPAASAQTPDDVGVRDQLIADQENLLNAYRCLFGVDVEVVPGGCPDPDQVAPGPAPQNPTTGDVEVRDRLIADQEALLNVYRCQFDVDTRLVLGGCETEGVGLGIPVVEVQTEVISIGGSSYRCAIAHDGAVVCWTVDWDNEGYWGEGGYSGELDAQLNVPEGVFTAISSSGGHSCAIRVDGTVACWGSNSYGQLDAPEGVFTAISVGDSYSCGIRAGGNVVCWTDTYWLVDQGAPEGVFTAISSSYSLSCGILQGGSVVCWPFITCQIIQGDSYCTGVGGSVDLDIPEGAFTAISVGTFHACAIRVDGTIVCWGSNSHGELDAPEGVFTAISAGHLGTCAITEEGVAVCWGSLSRYFEVVVPDEVFTAISFNSFGSYTCGVTQERAVVCWTYHHGNGRLIFDDGVPEDLVVLDQ